jgi:hypothetical protein
LLFLGVQGGYGATIHGSGIRVVTWEEFEANVNGILDSILPK